MKEQLLNHLNTGKLQEQTDGKLTILAFPVSVQQLPVTSEDTFTFPDYDEEAMLFAKVAKTCREEIFNENVKVSGSCDHGCHLQCGSQ